MKQQKKHNNTTENSINSRIFSSGLYIRKSNVSNSTRLN